MNHGSAAAHLLLVLVREQPRTLRAFEALAGPLETDATGREWFSVYRPRLDEPRRALSDALDSASLVFDPFRDAGPDPELEHYRLAVRLEHPEGLGLLRSELGEPVADVEDGRPAERFGAFLIRPHEGAILLDWHRPRSQVPWVPLDEAVRASFLGRLPQRLATAATAPLLRIAVTPPPGAGVALGVQPSHRPGRQETPVPLVTLALDPPLDAAALAGLWGMERPLGVSGDVHQQSWTMVVAGQPIESGHGPRVASSFLVAGPWSLRPRLDGRPPGPLPEVSSGASPAYDLRERGARVSAIEIAAD